MTSLLQRRPPNQPSTDIIYKRISRKLQHEQPTKKRPKQSGEEKNQGWQISYNIKEPRTSERLLKMRKRSGRADLSENRWWVSWSHCSRSTVDSSGPQRCSVLGWAATGDEVVGLLNIVDGVKVNSEAYTSAQHSVPSKMEKNWSEDDAGVGAGRSTLTLLPRLVGFKDDRGLNPTQNGWSTIMKLFNKTAQNCMVL